MNVSQRHSSNAIGHNLCEIVQDAGSMTLRRSRLLCSRPYCTKGDGGPNISW